MQARPGKLDRNAG